MRRLAIAGLVLAAASAGGLPAHAAVSGSTATVSGQEWTCSGPQPGRWLTTVPDRRHAAWWVKRVNETDAALKRTRYDIAFLGDSITQRWDPKAWADLVGDHTAINLGFNADRDENLLWRLENGELAGKLPRAFVLMIGTNNIGRRHPPERVADGIRLIIETLKRRDPGAPILLVGITPRGAAANAVFRKPIQETNRLIARCADDRTVFFVNPYDAMLDPGGVLTRATSPDLLHFSPAGYQRLIAVLKPGLAKLEPTVARNEPAAAPVAP